MLHTLVILSSELRVTLSMLDCDRILMVRSSIIIDQGAGSRGWMIKNPATNKEYLRKKFTFVPLFVCSILISLSQNCLRLRSKNQIMLLSSSQRHLFLTFNQPCKWPPGPRPGLNVFLIFSCVGLGWWILLIGWIRVYQKFSKIWNKTWLRSLNFFKILFK